MTAVYTCLTIKTDITGSFYVNIAILMKIVWMTTKKNVLEPSKRNSDFVAEGLQHDGRRALSASCPNSYSKALIDRENVVNKSIKSMTNTISKKKGTYTIYRLRLRRDTDYIKTWYIGCSEQGKYGAVFYINVNRFYRVKKTKSKSKFNIIIILV